MPGRGASPPNSGNPEPCPGSAFDQESFRLVESQPVRRNRFRPEARAAMTERTHEDRGRCTADRLGPGRGDGGGRVHRKSHDARVVRSNDVRNDVARRHRPRGNIPHDGHAGIRPADRLRVRPRRLRVPVVFRGNENSELKMWIERFQRVDHSLLTTGRRVDQGGTFPLVHPGAAFLAEWG